MMGVRVRITISLLVTSVKIAARRENRDRPMIPGLLDERAVFENLFAITMKAFVCSADMHT